MIIHYLQEMWENIIRPTTLWGNKTGHENDSDCYMDLQQMDLNTTWVRLKDLSLVSIYFFFPFLFSFFLFFFVFSASLRYNQQKERLWDVESVQCDNLKYIYIVNRTSCYLYLFMKLYSANGWWVNFRGGENLCCSSPCLFFCETKTPDIANVKPSWVTLMTSLGSNVYAFLQLRGDLTHQSQDGWEVPLSLKTCKHKIWVQLELKTAFSDNSFSYHFLD